MTSETHAASKRPVSSLLAGPYGHPFHPIAVTLPIGAWVASLVFDIGSRIDGTPRFLTHGSEWLIGIGIVGALGAAALGTLDLFGIAPHTSASRTALTHMSLNLLVTAAYAVGFWWRHTSTSSDGRVQIGQIVLSAVSLAVLGVSGALGGKLAYRYGVRVAAEASQATGFVTSSPHRASRD